jgi:hypothetical protein
MNIVNLLASRSPDTGSDGKCFDFGDTTAFESDFKNTTL